MSAMLLNPAARLDPRHTAVLVVDMQNDFCAEGGFIEKVIGKDATPCRAIAAPVMALVGDARAAGLPVIWLIADYASDKVPESMRARSGERGITQACCAPGTWGGQFYGVAPAAGEPVVVKHCYSGFIGTDLEARLGARGIRTLVFAGVQTNVCVESTLRDAHALGFYCVLAADCVASHTAELHDATMRNVAFLFGDVLPRAAIAGHWSRTPAS